MIDAESSVGMIAKRIGPGQKLCNVRGGPRSVHTWEIPEVFGGTTKSERALLEGIMYLRRKLRCRDSGDADPVSGSDLYRFLGVPVLRTLDALIAKSYVREVDGKYDLAQSFNGKFRRLAWDRPSYTVDTRFGDPRYFLHPDSNRGLTVREAARIQGFPDSFVFDGPERVQYKMVGNAVPPPVGHAVAEFVQRVLL